MEFGSDGTPLYVAVPGGSLENQGDHFIFKRSLKEAKMGGDIKAGAEDDSDKSGGEPIGRAHPIFKRSLILNSTSRVAGSIDQEYLEQIVNDFNRSLTHDEAGEEASVNFDDPIDLADLPLFHNEDLDHPEDMEGDLDNSDDFPVDFDIIYDKPTSGAAFTKGAMCIIILVSFLLFSRSNSFYFPSSKTHHRNKSRNAN